MTRVLDICAEAIAERVARLAVLVVCLSLPIASCATDTIPKCVPGAHAACPCPGSAAGAQTCRDDGTFDICRCTPASTPTSAPTPANSAKENTATRAAVLPTRYGPRLELFDEASRNEGEPRPVAWQVPNGPEIALSVRYKAAHRNGSDYGSIRLVALQPDRPAPAVITSFTCEDTVVYCAAYVRISVPATHALVFIHSPMHSGDPGRIRLLLLEWNADKGLPWAVATWDGHFGDEFPPWASKW